MSKVIQAAAVLSVTLLAGCSDSDVQEVKKWMDDTKKETRPMGQPIAEPKTFVPFAYTGKEVVDPFSQNKLLVALARSSNSTSALKPDPNRRKEPLESYPLDTIKMVGVMQKGGVTYALLQIDKTVHQVTAGLYVGQNDGKITQVTETGITIREVVQDAAGDWTTREAKLELQESK